MGRTVDMMKNFFVGVKALITNDHGQVLLLKDSSKEDFWDVPGGRIDDNESLHETLLRELYEELPGIHNPQISELMQAYRIPGSIKNDLGLVLIFYRVTASFPNGIMLSSEHNDYAWLSLDEARERGSDGVQSALATLSQSE